MPPAARSSCGAVGDRDPVVDAVERERLAEAAVRHAGGAGDRAVASRWSARAPSYPRAPRSRRRRRAPVLWTRDVRAAEVAALPVASRATAVIACGPSAAVGVSQLTGTGAVVSAAPRSWPSSWNWTLGHADGVGGRRGDGHVPVHAAAGRRGHRDRRRGRVAGDDGARLRSRPGSTLPALSTARTCSSRCRPRRRGRRRSCRSSRAAIRLAATGREAGGRRAVDAVLVDGLVVGRGAPVEVRAAGCARRAPARPERSAPACRPRRRSGRSGRVRRHALVVDEEDHVAAGRREVRVLRRR